MWISKDRNGNVEVFNFKPTLDKISGLFYANYDKCDTSFWFGRKNIASDLKRGQTKRITSIKIETKEK